MGVEATSPQVEWAEAALCPEAPLGLGPGPSTAALCTQHLNPVHSSRNRGSGPQGPRRGTDVKGHGMLHLGVQSGPPSCPSGGAAQRGAGALTQGCSYKV